MSELTFIALRLGFLALLWVFVFIIVYALRSDLFGATLTKVPPSTARAEPSDPSPEPAPAPAAAAAAPVVAATPKRDEPSPPKDAPIATAETVQRLVFTKGPKSGTEFPLTPGQISIGRAAHSDIVIRDDYASTNHARLMVWHGEWTLQDLDSTNGTFLDGTRVTVPTPIPVRTPITIGTSTFELRP